MNKPKITNQQKTNDLLKSRNEKQNNSKTKINNNNNNQNIILKNKTLKNSIANSLLKDKSKSKLQNVNSINSFNKPNNLKLRNNYIKIKNKPIIGLKKILNNPKSQRKENKFLNGKNNNENKNKLIRGNSTSYARTAVSTANGNITDNAISSKRNENLFKQLIENIDIKNIEKISKVDLLQNNIFLSKIYSFIYNLISSDYCVFELENNHEIKQQFQELNKKIDFLNNKFVICNLMNSNLFDSYNCNNEIMNILEESNNRKLIYKNFFDFFKNLLNDIIKLTKEIKKRENKKNEEIDSINSNSNFTKNIIKENTDTDILNNLSIKDNIFQIENNKYYGMDESNGISSIDNEYYQLLLKNSFKDENKKEDLSKSKIISRNRQLNNHNFSYSTSSVINNNDSSDSETIYNFSISDNNSTNKKNKIINVEYNNNNIKKLENKKQINIQNINSVNILNNHYLYQQKENNKLNQNVIDPITLNKPIIKEKFINSINYDDKNCYIF